MSKHSVVRSLTFDLVILITIGYFLLIGRYQQFKLYETLQDFKRMFKIFRIVVNCAMSKEGSLNFGFWPLLQRTLKFTLFETNYQSAIIF